MSIMCRANWLPVFQAGRRHEPFLALFRLRVLGFQETAASSDNGTDVSAARMAVEDEGRRKPGSAIRGWLLEGGSLGQLRMHPLRSSPQDGSLPVACVTTWGLAVGRTSPCFVCRMRKRCTVRTRAARCTKPSCEKCSQRIPLKARAVSHETCRDMLCQFNRPVDCQALAALSCFVMRWHTTPRSCRSGS